MAIPSVMQIFALWVGTILGAFIDTLAHLFFFIVGFIVSIILTVKIKGKWYKKIIPVPAFIASLVIAFQLTNIGNISWIILNGNTLKKLTHAIESNGALYRMSYLNRHQKMINDCHRATDDKINSKEDLKRLFGDCLDPQKVNPDDIMKIKKLLEKCGFISFIKRDDYIIFMTDGFIDNCYGFTYSRNGNTPEIKDDKFIDDLVSFRQVFRRWYFWTST
jgi:hypothetical protein